MVFDEDSDLKPPSIYPTDFGTELYKDSREKVLILYKVEKMVKDLIKTLKKINKVAVYKVYNKVTLKDPADNKKIVYIYLYFFTIILY